MLLFASPMCQTFCRAITTMISDANKVSEVKYKNFVEECVKHLPGNAGVLFLHENLWNSLSRRPSIVKKMAESVGMYKTKSELCRSHSTMCSPRTGSCLESKSEYITDKLSMCCCNRKKGTKTDVKKVMMMVLRCLKRENDSVKAICSKKVGRTAEKPTWWAASMWLCLTQDCCENRDRWKQIS